MSEKNDLLGIINYGCFGFPDMNSIYDLHFDDLVIISFCSILISIVLHSFFYKTKFKVSNNNQIEMKQYSLITKIIMMFFILILLSTPIFKLLRVSYFL